MPLGCNHDKPVAGVELGFEFGHHRPLRSIAPQRLVPQWQRVFTEVQRPSADAACCRERLAQEPADFRALGFGAMAPDDDADSHADAQAARVSLNKVNVRSLAWLAAVAS